MIRFNLLPYRAIRRSQRKREFGVVMVGFFIAMAALWYAGKLYLDSQINAQDQRNQQLVAENKKLGEQIAQIKKLKEQTAEMTARKQVVESLQANRSSTVKLLDQLPRRIPEGLYLREVREQGAQVTITGHAQSNEQVAVLMKTLNESGVMQGAELVESKAVTFRNRVTNEFVVKVKVGDLLPRPEDNLKSTSLERPLGAAGAPTARDALQQRISK